MDGTLSLSERVWLYDHYGDSLRAIYTLFEITLAGCWPSYLRPLIEKVSGWYVIFVFIYVSVVVFALTRIISALFLKETLQIASNDAVAQANEQQKSKRIYVNKMRKLFEAVNAGGTGSISLDQFNHMLTNPDVVVVLKSLDFEVHDAQNLFHMLDVNMAGEITFDDFIKGMTRMKGPARSVDLVTLMGASDRMFSKLLSVSESMSILLKKIIEDEEKIIKDEEKILANEACILSRVSETSNGMSPTSRVTDESHTGQFPNTLTSLDDEVTEATICGM